MTDEKGEEELRKIGVKDSKLLTHKKREFFAEKIVKIAKTKIIRINPAEIDAAVESGDGMNLNWLEAHKTAEIINTMKPDRVILDCPSPNIEAYVKYLRKLLKVEVEIVAEHKADVHYPIVSAASIIAKVAREDEVFAIEKKIGKSIGSGYSSNPVCQKFIKDNYNKYPDLFRKSWSTFKNAEQKDLTAFE